METDFGLTEYLGDREHKISCILKEMYSDFVVQEVLVDGTVLPIKQPSDVLASVKDEENKEPDADITAPDFLSEETVKNLDAMDKTSKAVRIPTKDLAKDQRRGVHEFIRQRYGGRLNSETKDNDIYITYQGVNSNSRKRKRWPPGVPDYCHFTLAKENKDTSYALGVVAKFLNVQQSIFRTHGIKDRRAVTSQRVSCHHVDKERLMSLNSRLRDLLLYDFAYGDADIRMGGHRGNRFNIVLRNVGGENKNILEERLSSLSKRGFINYFGLQRFGSCDVSTAEVGKLVLQRKWEEAVRTIMHDGDLPAYMGTVGDAVRRWRETGDAKEALRCLKGGQAYASIEATILRCLGNGGTWQSCITEAIPMSTRSLYVHAYQSLLWNKVASRKISELRDQLIVEEPDSSLYNIKIPLPFKDSVEGDKDVTMMRELLAADELTFDSISSLSGKFSLNETSRYLLVLPEDVEWDFISYSDPRAYLQDGISTRAIPKEEQTGDLLAVRVKFNLPPGTYATVALRELTGFDMGKKSMKVASGFKAKEDLKVEDDADQDGDDEVGDEPDAACEMKEEELQVAA